MPFALTKLWRMATTDVLRNGSDERPRSGPSHVDKRLVVGAVALVGAAISIRLAAYQLGWAAAPWEPFFGDGSRRVLKSAFSRSLPFPDAGAGAVAYLAEVVAVAWGGPERFRTHRLAVYVYAAIATLMALGSAGLVIVQIAFVHAFCTLCLASALISFVLVAPAWSELLAALREIVQNSTRCRGRENGGPRRVERLPR